MPRTLKTSFNAGEFSPNLYGRYDLPRYQSACKTLLNAVVKPQGGVMRRPGFKYIASVKNAGDYTRLIPFKFSEEQSYILEFGDTYIRFFMNGGQIWSLGTDTKLLLHFDGEQNSKVFTDESAGAHTLTSNGGAKIKQNWSKFGIGACYFDGVDAYATAPDHADWYFSNGSWTIDCWVARGLGDTGDCGIWFQGTDADNYHGLYYDYSDEELTYHRCASGVITEYLNGSTTNLGTYSPATYTADYVHIAVVYHSSNLYLFLNGELLDSYSGSITIGDYTGAFNIGRCRNNSDTYKYWSGAIDEFRVVKGAGEWTAAFQPPSEPYPYDGVGGGSAVYEIETTYTEDDLQRLDFAQSADVMYITHPDYAVKKLSRTAHANWTLATVSFTNAPATWASHGYPYSVCFFQDRLCFGGNANNPDTVWMSVSGSYEDFTSTADDDNRVSVTLSAREVNKIQWMAPSRRLLVGTASSEWWISGTSDQSPVTQSEFIARKDSDWGSSKIRPVHIGTQVFFIQRMGSALREMAYDYVEDKYISTNPGIVADHLFEGHEIQEMDYQQIPYSIIWMIRDDGTLLGFTYLKDHKVFGWHRHTTGADGEFESLAVIPGSLEDELWVVVKRTINGSDVRYIERLDPFYYQSLTYYFGVDSGLKGELGSTTAVSGLTHLEGETVDVFALVTSTSIPTILGDEIVSSGAITLDSASDYASIGLNYVTDIETLEMPTEDEHGATVGVVKRITNVSMNLKDTCGGQYGPSSSSLMDIPDTADTTLYDGWTSDMEFNEGYDETATVFIRQEEPLPLEVLALNIEYDDEV